MGVGGAGRLVLFGCCAVGIRRGRCQQCVDVNTFGGQVGCQGVLQRIQGHAVLPTSRFHGRQHRRRAIASLAPFLATGVDLGQRGAEGLGFGLQCQAEEGGESILRHAGGKLDDLLSSAEFSPAEDNYCQVTLTDNEHPPLAMERLRTRFPHTLVLMFVPETARDAGPQSYGERIAKAADELDLCCGFLDHVRHRGADDDEQRLLRAALAGVREQDGSL